MRSVVLRFWVLERYVVNIYVKKAKILINLSNCGNCKIFSTKNTQNMQNAKHNKIVLSIKYPDTYLFSLERRLYQYIHRDDENKKIYDTLPLPSPLLFGVFFIQYIPSINTKRGFSSFLPFFLIIPLTSTPQHPNNLNLG